MEARQTFQRYLGEVMSDKKAKTRGGKTARPLKEPIALKGPRWRLTILSRKRSLYSTRRLVEATRARGHRPLVLDTLKCNLILSPPEPRITYRGVEVKGIDVVIPRIGASITSYGLAVVNHLEMMGIPVVNPSNPISKSRDKLRCLQLLSRGGLDVPCTVMAHDRTNVSKLVEEVGGLPAIIKLLRGTQGVGVMIASTMQEVQTILDTFWDLGQEIFIQEFIAEAKGTDLRALVVGDRVVGAMRRKAKKGEFRSNLHRGGEGKPVSLSREAERAAVRAAQLIGLGIAGVDLLESKDGPKVMEVNSSPGFEGLERATKTDIAGEMVDYAASLARARAERGKLRTTAG